MHIVVPGCTANYKYLDFSSKVTDPLPFLVKQVVCHWPFTSFIAAVLPLSQIHFLLPGLFCPQLSVLGLRWYQFKYNICIWVSLFCHIFWHSAVPQPGRLLQQPYYCKRWIHSLGERSKKPGTIRLYFRQTVCGLRLGGLWIHFKLSSRVDTVAPTKVWVHKLIKYCCMYSRLPKCKISLLDVSNMKSTWNWKLASS